jgi:hypothetical protein
MNIDYNAIARDLLQRAEWHHEHPLARLKVDDLVGFEPPIVAPWLYGARRPPWGCTAVTILCFAAARAAELGESQAPDLDPPELIWNLRGVLCMVLHSGRIGALSRDSITWGTPPPPL